MPPWPAHPSRPPRTREPADRWRRPEMWLRLEGTHLEKADIYIRGLKYWLRDNPTAAFHDRLVAQSVMDELRWAGSGYP